MNRTAQKKLRKDMVGATRAEIRRARRGRLDGSQAGKGNGHHGREVVLTSKMRADRRAGDRLIGKIIETIVGDGSPSKS